jgi:hypothetical protein
MCVTVTPAAAAAAAAGAKMLLRFHQLQAHLQQSLS